MGIVLLRLGALNTVVSREAACAGDAAPSPAPPSRTRQGLLLLRLLLCLRMKLLFVMSFLFHLLLSRMVSLMLPGNVAVADVNISPRTIVQPP